MNIKCNQCIAFFFYLEYSETYTVVIPGVKVKIIYLRLFRLLIEPTEFSSTVGEGGWLYIILSETMIGFFWRAAIYHK